MNKKFNELPEEYFAQKFNDPNLPLMKPFTLRVSLIAMIIFYLINYTVGCKSDYTAIRFSAYAAFAVAAVMLVLRMIFGKKMIIKHPLCFIRCCIYSFAELKLFLLQTFTLITANVLSDKLIGINDELVVNCTCIFGAVMLLIDAIINLAAWKKMKNKIIAGAYKEGGSGLFGNMKNKNKIWQRVLNVCCAVGGAAYAAMLLNRIFEDFFYEISDYIYIPLLAVFCLALIFLFCVLAVGNAYLKGRIHYIRKFGLSNAIDGD